MIVAPREASVVPDHMEDRLDMPLADVLPRIQESIMNRTTYFGVPTLKNPMDAWIYQEIVFESKPDVIVEIGNRHGGSALYFAHLCDLLGKGRVIGVDLSHESVPDSVKKHPRITFLDGDAARSVPRVAGLIAAEERVLVIEDSSHTYDNTLDVLRAYSPLVKPGDYFIVEDSICHHGLDTGPNPGPYEAIEQFVREQPDFAVDRERERFLITWNPKGFLKRTGASARPAAAPSNGEKPDYGIDAPGVVRNLFIVAALGLTAFFTARFGLWSGVIAHVALSYSGLWAGLGCCAMGCWMLYDSKIGKLKERERLLDRVPWRGEEAVLDVGCGRGLLLIGAARRLTTGKATGLDIWQTEDLTGNTPEATLSNARREGVADRVAVKTGDMRKMPFPDATFDVIVSNVAIHNVYEREGRDATMREIARVLKPGGSVVIHDIRWVGDYALALKRAGLVEVARVGSRSLRFALVLITFGSLRPDIVTARRPHGGRKVVDG